MNQIKFIIASVLVGLMTTSGITSSISAGFAVIYPGAATAAATGTMTLEQLLVWIQQYNLAHPENPIVLDMNTILSVPPQQIKTVIETHINTVTHDDDNNSHDGHNNHDHDSHHHFDWASLFHNHHNNHDFQHNVDGNDPRQQELQKKMQEQQQHESDNGNVDFSGGKDDLTHSDDDNPGIPAASDGESDNSGSDGSSNSGDSGGSSSSDDSSSGSSSDSGDSGSGGGGGGDGGGSGSDSGGGGGDSSDSNN